MKRICKAGMTYMNKISKTVSTNIKDIRGRTREIRKPKMSYEYSLPIQSKDVL